MYKSGHEVRRWKLLPKIAVLGGGIAGLTVAVELAKAGNQIQIIEKTDQLGGNIKNFGCKAVDKCTKCNLCLVDDIMLASTKMDNIDISYETFVNDLRGEKGNYSLGIEKDASLGELTGFDKIILATGFTRWSKLETGTVEAFKNPGIIWASQLEELLKNRGDHIAQDNLLNLDYKVNSVVFIQCNGSRSIQEKASFCSRICCGYSYRMAQALQKFFPEIKINIFFMDLQEGSSLQELTFSKLDDAGIDYINCRPIRVKEDEKELKVIYEEQQTGKMAEFPTDLIVLSEGSYPNSDNEKLASIFNLQLDEYGFLNPIEEEAKTGIYLAGTIKGPADIATTISASKNVAYGILNN